MLIIDEFNIDTKSAITTVELEKDRYVDVKWYLDDLGSWTGYVLQNEDGSLVYDCKDNTYADYPVNEKEIMDFLFKRR